MFSLLFLFFVNYAVKCDDISNYYVIEMPEFQTPTRESKPFQVYWNVPTMQCQSKGIPFHDLYERYGIIQNKRDSFRGEKIAILYDPGDFPALLKNESSGKFKFRNGGVPQEGNIDQHLKAFKIDLDYSIPDRNFNGLGIIDFESWRPVFRQNFGVLSPYRDVSLEIEKKSHWWWPRQWILDEARSRFETAARQYMQTTLSLAKQMRPSATWGYYGYPYCFNMASNHLEESCANGVKEENDNIHWLWSETIGLYPSVYTYKHLTHLQLSGLIRGRVREAERIKIPGTIVIPYFCYKYREGGLLTKSDLEVALKTLYEANVSGMIMWGSSNDVNTVEKCIKLRNYLEQIMGPAIAEYTKRSHLIKGSNQSSSVSNRTSEIKDYLTTTTTTTMRSNMDNLNIKTNSENTELDSEFHWQPPKNYIQDIAQNVQEMLKKSGKTSINYNEPDDNLSESVLKNRSFSLMNDIIFNKTLINQETPSKNEGIKFIRLQHLNLNTMLSKPYRDTVEDPEDNNLRNRKTFDVAGNLLRDLIMNGTKVTMKTEFQRFDSNEPILDNNQTTELINHRIENNDSLPGHDYNLLHNQKHLFQLFSPDTLIAAESSLNPKIETTTFSNSDVEKLSEDTTIAVSTTSINDSYATAFDNESTNIDSNQYTTYGFDQTPDSFTLDSTTEHITSQEIISRKNYSFKTTEFFSSDTTTDYITTNKSSSETGTLDPSDDSDQKFTTNTYSDYLTENMMNIQQPKIVDDMSSPEYFDDLIYQDSREVTESTTKNILQKPNEAASESISSKTTINMINDRSQTKYFQYNELDTTNVIDTSTEINNLMFGSSLTSTHSSNFIESELSPDNKLINVIPSLILSSETPENLVKTDDYKEMVESHTKVQPIITNERLSKSLDIDKIKNMVFNTDDSVEESNNTSSTTETLLVIEKTIATFDNTDVIDPPSLSLTSISSTSHQVSGSAASRLFEKYIICLIFYLRSLSKCLGEIYG